MTIDKKNQPIEVATPSDLQIAEFGARDKEVIASAISEAQHEARCVALTLRHQGMEEQSQLCMSLTLLLGGAFFQYLKADPSWQSLAWTIDDQCDGYREKYFAGQDGTNEFGADDAQQIFLQLKSNIQESLRGLLGQKDIELSEDARDWFARHLREFESRLRGRFRVS